MTSYDHDPEIYNVMCYMLLFIGFYIFFKVFTLNEEDSEECKPNEHSN